MKLFNYHLKNLFSKTIYWMIGYLLLGLVTRLTLTLTAYTSVISEMIPTILMILTVLFIPIICALVTVKCLQYSYKTLYGNQAYLNFTLPVSKRDVLLSELFASIVMSLVLGVVIIAGIFLMTSFDVIQDLAYFISSSFQELFAYGVSGGDIFLTILIILVDILVSSAVFYLSCYLAMDIAHQFEKHRLILGILSYIGISIVSSVLYNLLSLLLEQVSSPLYRSLEVASTGTVSAALQLFNLSVGGSVLYTLLFGILLFFANMYLLKNYLNLD